MKTSQKITRLKLNIEQENDYLLLGLVTAEPDYKVCLALNKKLGILLKNIPPVRVMDTNRQELTFSRFSDKRANDEMVTDLISNRTGSTHLLSKLKNIDYLLQVQKSEKDIDPDQLASKIREIETITAVFIIDVTTIKDRNLHYLNQ